MRRAVELPPGVFRSATDLQSKGRFWDADLVRWENGSLTPIKGWREKTASRVRGAARSILAWTDNSGQAWLAIGTHSNLYVMDRGGTVTDITPIRAQASLTAPFATVNGSPIAIVTHAGHGAASGDEVVFSDGVTVGGLTLSGAYELTKTGPDSYNIDAGANASAADSGGGTVTAKYRISPGRADSDFRGGYGNDTYGSGTYGTPRSDNINPNDVTVWSLDVWGQYLVACQADNGGIYEWRLNTADPAEPIDNAPTARAIVVTSNRILMALGANGNPRAVAWSDQEDNTVWTAASTNYAGDFNLQTTGKIMCGRRVRGGTLILTTSDVWLAEDQPQPFVFGFRQKGGAGTGVISQGAVATVDGEAVVASCVWLGAQQVFGYNGAVFPIPCEASGLIFPDINRTQISKASAFHDADYGEVWFLYPSGASTEIDRYLAWNYREGWWAPGYSMPRLCGTERGVFENPLAVNVSGVIYEHEVGYDYGGAEPWAETGVFSVGEGDQVSQVLRIIPDEQTLGDVTAKFFTAFEPNGAETQRGPFALSAETPVRFTSRFFRLRLTGARLAAWKVGRFVLDVATRGGR